MDEHAASGRAQRAFCAECGISLASLGNWKRRLTHEAGAAEPWVEWLGVSESHTGGWEIELDLGARLRLRRCLWGGAYLAAWSTEPTDTRNVDTS